MDMGPPGGYGDMRTTKGVWGPLGGIWGPLGEYGGIKTPKEIWGHLGGIWGYEDP